MGIGRTMAFGRVRKPASRRGCRPSASGGHPKRGVAGQMTVELAVTIPVLIAMALVVCNAMLFFEDCAAFDRLAKDAVRSLAATPGHGQGIADGAAAVQSYLASEFDRENLAVSVDASWGPGSFCTYTATLRFRPTLFGRSFSGQVFGVDMFTAEHHASLVVDPYRPGAIL